MPKKSVAIGEFFENFERAHDEGLIQMYGRMVNERYGERDYFAYIGNGTFEIDETNARPLTDETRIVAEVVRRMNEVNKPWIVLGPGAGVSSSQLYDMGMTVDCVSQTPLAPWIKPRRNISSLAYTNCTTKRLLTYFDRSQAPYVRNQFLIDFPSSQPVLPERAYVAADDCYGALYYARNKQKALMEVLQSLRDDGMLVMNTVDALLLRTIQRMQRQWRHRFALAIEHSTTRMNSSECDPAVFIGKQSPIVNKNECVLHPTSLVQFLQERTGFMVDDLFAYDAESNGQRGNLHITSRRKGGHLSIHPWRKNGLM